MVLPAWMPVIFYAVVIMVFIGVFSWTHLEANTERKYFSVLVFLTAFMLVNDFVSRMYIYDWFPLWLVVVTTYVNFLVLPAIGIGWYWFVRSVLTAEERYSAQTVNIIILVIACIGFAALLINPFTGAVFAFDETGTYYRGPLFFFPAGSTFLCIVIAEAFIIRRVRNLGRSVLISMLIFPVPPLVGGIVAMFIYGVPWMPLGIALSMVILYAALQDSSLGTDFLTGLHNRRKLDEFMEERMTHPQPGRKVAAIMVDIDDFKVINDSQGHAVGDLVLAQTAHLLRRSVRVGDIVARFGGDEFVILLDVKDESELGEVVARIEKELEAFNAQDHAFTLYLSMGQCVCDTTEYTDVGEFMERLDKLMYANKLQNKLERAKQLAS